MSCWSCRALSLTSPQPCLWSALVGVCNVCAHVSHRGSSRSFLTRTSFFILFQEEVLDVFFRICSLSCVIYEASEITVLNPPRHHIITVMSTPQALAHPAGRALWVVAQAGITAVTIPRLAWRSHGKGDDCSQGCLHHYWVIHRLDQCSSTNFGAEKQGLDEKGRIVVKPPMLTCLTRTVGAPSLVFSCINCWVVCLWKELWDSDEQCCRAVGCSY